MKKIFKVIGIIYAVCTVIYIGVSVFAVLFILMESRKTYYWDFEYEADDIKEIKIVEVVGYPEFSVVKEINIVHADELYSEIASLEMKVYGTNLSEPFDKCFLIVFENGEYDIISKIESQHYKYNYGSSKYYEYDELVPHHSWRECRDYDQFDALINKYLEE